MKRYDITVGNQTYEYMADHHYFDRELNTVIVTKNGEIVCMFGIQGLILEIRDEQFLKEEEERRKDLQERLKKSAEAWKKLYEKPKPKKHSFEYWINKIFN